MEQQEPRGLRLVWEYIYWYSKPRVFLPLLARTEWDENWGAWPHCMTQGGCWMHITYPPPRCSCRCFWCRLARGVFRKTP